MADKSGKPRVVFLNHKTGRYDVSNLPQKKTKRNSSSFVRRKVEVSVHSNTDQPPEVEVTDETVYVGNNSSFTAVTHQVDQIDAYKLQLITSKGFTVLHRQPNRIISAIQEFDTSLGNLKTNKFHVVDCAQKYFADGCNWVPTCTCNPRGQELANSLIFKLSQTFQEFQSSLPMCLHGSATMYFINQFEVFNDLEIASYQSAGDHDYAISCEVHELPSSCDVVCVNVSGSRNYGFVGICLNRLTCLSCQYNKHGCVHVQSIEKALSASDPNLPGAVYNMVSRTSIESSSQTESANGPTKHSQYPIPFIVPEYLQTLFRTGLMQACVLKSSSVDFAMIPHTTGSTCSVCGSLWSSLDPVAMDWNGSSTIVFTMNTMFWCKVYFRKCSNTLCNEVLHLDGREYGVLWIGKRMISYEVLRDFMHLYLHSGITLHSFFKIWEQRHFDSGSTTFRHYIEYNSWRFAWFWFLELLEIDYEECFTCGICGKEPRAMICDATSVAFQSKFTQSTSIQHLNQSETIRQGSHNERVMVPNKGTRSLLQMFSKKQVTDGEKLHLLSLLESFCPSLCAIIRWIDGRGLSDTHPDILSLLYALGCNSPVCAILHPEEDLLDVFDEIISDDSGKSVISDQPKMQILQTKCPLVFRAISALQSDVAEPWKTLFQDMIKKATSPFRGQPIVTPGPASNSVPVEEAPKPLSYFPSLSLRRERPIFATDQRKDGARVCTKLSHGHPSLLPGIFTVFCPHGICYGFEVMDCHESPNIPFTIIWTRFERAPSVFIYDNACNFHKYCLNRDPEFFKGCWCLVDRFHWKNHKACSEGYRMSSYPQFDSLNSQINEQRNSSLKKLKSSLSYMNLDNFMNHVKFYLWNLNRKALSNLH